MAMTLRALFHGLSKRLSCFPTLRKSTRRFALRVNAVSAPTRTRAKRMEFSVITDQGLRKGRGGESGFARNIAHEGEKHKPNLREEDLTGEHSNCPAADADGGHFLAVESQLNPDTSRTANHVSLFAHHRYSIPIQFHPSIFGEIGSK